MLIHTDDVLSHCKNVLTVLMHYDAWICWFKTFPIYNVRKPLHYDLSGDTTLLFSFLSFFFFYSSLKYSLNHKVTNELKISFIPAEFTSELSKGSYVAPSTFAWAILTEFNQLLIHVLVIFLPCCTITWDFDWECSQILLHCLHLY